MIEFNGPLKPGDKVTVECEGKKFEGRIEEIAFCAGKQVRDNIWTEGPIKLTVALIRAV